MLTGREPAQLMRLKTGYHKPIRHIDAKLVPAQPSRCMACQPSDQPVLLFFTGVQLFKSASRHATVDECVTVPDGVNASR